MAIIDTLQRVLSSRTKANISLTFDRYCMSTGSEDPRALFSTW